MEGIFKLAIVITIIIGCSNGQQLKNNQEDPCKTKQRVVSDEIYCDRYWECINNQPELYDCPNGLVFAGKHRGVTEGCDYPWRSNYCDGKQLANGPISTEHCDWLYGIFGHETSCTRYWTCWNGTATEQLCIGGLLYNENAHSCDWPEHVDGCQKHPLCNDDPNGNVALGKSCNRYWQCQGGYPRLQRCPAMLVFDKHSLRCVVPPTEECEVPTTQITPFDEDYNTAGNNNNNNNGNNQNNEAINENSNIASLRNNNNNNNNNNHNGNVKFNNNNNIQNNKKGNTNRNTNSRNINNNNNRNENNLNNNDNKKGGNFRDEQQLEEEAPPVIPLKTAPKSRYQQQQQQQQQN